MGELRTCFKGASYFGNVAVFLNPSFDLKKNPFEDLVDSCQFSLDLAHCSQNSLKIITKTVLFELGVWRHAISSRLMTVATVDRIIGKSEWRQKSNVDGQRRQQMATESKS